MSIRLTYYLGKNKTNLKTFCERMNIGSHNELEVYCVSKNIACDVTKEEYEIVFLKEKKNEEKIIEKTKAKPKAKPKTRRRSRKPKAKTTGNSDSKDNS